MYIHKDIFACLFSIHNIISLSCHEQVCLSGLAHLNILVHDMINLLYYNKCILAKSFQKEFKYIIGKFRNLKKCFLKVRKNSVSHTFKLKITKRKIEKKRNSLQNIDEPMKFRLHQGSTKR